jgi:zinc/manganese transport system substrate-binding protein
MVMKKIISVLCFLLLPFAAEAKLNVVATIPVFAAIAREVGGDRVEVTSLARGNQDPHFLDAKPQFVVALNHADVLIHGGLDLEVGWLPAILTQARNPKINFNSPGNVDASTGLAILEIPQGKVDRSMGDVHPRGNPHSWLDPRNAKIMAVNFYKHLAAVDPSGRDYYEGRAKAFVDGLSDRIPKWEARAKALRGAKVITYHKSFSYLADWLGFEVVAFIEPKPGIPPSSRHVDALLDQIPGLGVKVILVESFYPKKVPEYLSTKAQIPYLLLPTDTDEYGIATYEGLIDYLLDHLLTIK